MSWRVFLCCGAGAALIGCGVVDRATERPGRFRLDRAAPSRGRLLEVSVQALFCAADTTLSIVGADRSWSAAIALRTTWPSSDREFTIDSMVRGLGSAAVGARPLDDSVGAALTSLHGTVLLVSDADRVAGTLDLVARDAKGDTVRLAGRFDAPAATPGGCPAP